MEKLTDEHNILHKFHCSFSWLHSTETALLRLSNNLLMHCIAGEGSMLVLLTLSAALETLGHCDHCKRLKHSGWASLDQPWSVFFSIYFALKLKLKLSFVGFPKVPSLVRFCLHYAFHCFSLTSGPKCCKQAFDQGLQNVTCNTIKLISLHWPLIKFRIQFKILMNLVWSFP